MIIIPEIFLYQERVLFTSDKEVSSTQGNTHSCYNGGMRECVNRMIDVRSCDILTACLMAILARLYHCLLSV